MDWNRKGNQKRKRPQESTAEADVMLKKIKAVRGHIQTIYFVLCFLKQVKWKVFLAPCSVGTKRLPK